ncbi:MAG: hypothetical protein LYZ69_07855 [Nitrososphaerales archaeon]|nr:hypothetical protein [Nitrososphaerales archaeon]
MDPTRKQALFSEGNVPPGGVCLSFFVVLRHGNKILIGKMAKPEIWVGRFFVRKDFAPTYASSGKFLLPARHLAWYESPLEAAEGVVRDQLQLKVQKGRLRMIDAQSHVRGDIDNKDQPPHWDICFVFETKVSERFVRTVKPLPWFTELGFRRLSDLTPNDFTRGHGDVLEVAGLLKTKRA